MSTDRQITKKVVALSKVYRDLAGKILDRAYELYKDGVIDEATFWLVRQQYYDPILREATKILMVRDTQLTVGLDAHFAGLADATKELERVTKQVKNVVKIVEVAAKVLSAVVTVAGFVINPSGAAVGLAAAATKGAVDEIE